MELHLSCRRIYLTPRHQLHTRYGHKLLQGTSRERSRERSLSCNVENDAKSLGQPSMSDRGVSSCATIWGAW